MNNNYYVYILTNWNNRVMYVGVTNDLERRLYEPAPAGGRFYKEV